jgi:hypothetical protein
MSMNDLAEHLCANYRCKKRADEFVDVQPYPVGQVQDLPEAGIPLCADCTSTIRGGNVRVYWVIPNSPGKYLFLFHD